jgi:hypothetical protein
MSISPLSPVTFWEACTGREIPEMRKQRGKNRKAKLKKPNLNGSKPVEIPDLINLLLFSLVNHTWSPSRIRLWFKLIIFVPVATNEAEWASRQNTVNLFAFKDRQTHMNFSSFFGK